MYYDKYKEQAKNHYSYHRKVGSEKDKKHYEDNKKRLQKIAGNQYKELSDEENSLKKGIS